MGTLKNWSTVAADNATADATINWAEGQAPSTVNNSSRAMMAAHATQYREAAWHWVEKSSVSFSLASQTVFRLGTLGGDVTTAFTAGRRVRLTGGSATRTGHVISASYTSETTVTIAVDSGSLSASMNIVALGPATTASPIGVQTDGVAASTGLLLSGTYTPTLTNTTNLDGSTAYACQYIRVGKNVIVSGQFDADATSGGGADTVLGISLPIASDFANANECGGSAACITTLEAVAILGDAANNRATARWPSQGTNNRSYYFSFIYRVI